LTVRWLWEANTPVITCGYRKSAIAEPRASDAYPAYRFEGRFSCSSGTFEKTAL
jgi:hypothetical protein